MRLPVSFRTAAWLAIVLLCCGAADAQVPESLPDVAPMSLGPVQLYPTYVSEIEWTDNLFYRPEGVENENGPTSAFTASLVPSVVVTLPFSGSRALFGYAGRFRDYYHQRTADRGSDATIQLPSNYSHFVLAEVEFDFGERVQLGLRDAFERGVLDTDRIDPGEATTFRGEKFQTNNAELSLDYARSETRRLGLSVSKYTVRYLQEGITSFFDIDERGFALHGEHHLMPRLLGRWEVATATADLERGVQEFRRESVDATRVGAELQVAPGSTLSWNFEYSRRRYDQASGSSEGATRESSLSGDISYSRGVPGRLRLATTLSRGIYRAAYLNNNEYVSDRVSLRLSNEPPSRTDLGGSVTYYLNRYPERIEALSGSLDEGFNGQRRTDRTVDVHAWIGYRLSSWLTVRITARRSSRTSVLPRFEYDVNSLGVVVRVGT